MKITIQEFEEFEKEFLFQKIANPYYRLGQAFINTFPKISLDMEGGGDLGYQTWHDLWACDDREGVLKLVDWYIIR